MSAGKKVEKTIIFHQDNRFYIFMVEMKRSISPRKFEEDIAKKYEQSLATLSVFISAHFDFTHFEESKIFPIGICCYNYYKDTQPNYNRDKKWIAGSFRRKYEEGKREMLIPVNPLTLNVMQMPIVLCENLNDPITNSFEIDLEDILSRAISLSE